MRAFHQGPTNDRFPTKPDNRNNISFRLISDERIRGDRTQKWDGAAPALIRKETDGDLRIGENAKWRPRQDDQPHQNHQENQSGARDNTSYTGPNKVNELQGEAGHESDRWERVLAAKLPPPVGSFDWLSKANTWSAEATVQDLVSATRLTARLLHDLAERLGNHHDEEVNDLLSEAFMISNLAHDQATKVNTFRVFDVSQIKKA